MPRKDISLSKAAQRIAEDLKRLADSDHPLRKLSRVTFPDDHPIRKFGRELANLPEDHPLRKMSRDAQRLAELREQQRRELKAKKRAKKKKTRPPVEIPHLDAALKDLAAARAKDKKLHKPKAGAQHVMTFLKNKHRVVLPDSQQRTIERRIADRDKSQR
jgi:hypothetical protein